MARKRKKSKARKKSRDDKGSGGKASAQAEPKSSQRAEEPEAGQRAEEPQVTTGHVGGSEVVHGVDEPEVIDLDLEDDLLDEQERERLIAEMLSLDSRLTEPASDELGEAGDEEGQAPDAEGQAPDAERQVPDEERQAPDEERLAADSEARPPRLTPDALAALSAMHYEGLAVLPGEFVVDLGEATTEEERDRVLAAALAHAEMQEAIYRVPADTGNARRIKGALASVIFLLAILVAARPPAIVMPEPTARLTVADRMHGARMALLLQAQQIEAFRAREGRLPSSLAEVEGTLPGVRFVRSSSRLYQLVAYAPTGAAIVYDSALPDPMFAAITTPWTASASDGT